MTSTSSQPTETEEPGAAGYAFREIEARWRQAWLDSKTFRTLSPGDDGFNPDQPKCYVLDMFPYPSGSGLHIGHPKGYIATDIYSRFKRMQGFNVLHPMGFDSFGLPTEQYAREHNIHPAVVTRENIDNMRSQLQFLGLSYDWDREIATSHPDYYRWTQWIFLQLFHTWFDSEHEWVDKNGRRIQGKGRPIGDLIQAFSEGRPLTQGDSAAASVGEGARWETLIEAQKQTVLNNYRLAYEKEVVVNWCPALGTVLANEEVTSEGKSERGDHPVFKRPLRQWIMRITDYADRLLEDLHAELDNGKRESYRLEWPDAVKLMQQNWIGRSTGAEVLFDVLDPGSEQAGGQLSVFTTRPDTLFGATFMVVAPEHPLVAEGSESFLAPDAWPSEAPDSWKGEDPSLGIREALQAYRVEAERNAQAREKGKEKTGIFTGIFARNPVNDAKVPIFAADYVSMDYGSGAIMGVPAHDERDFDFAKAHGLDVITVVEPVDGEVDGCFSGAGVSVDSPAQGANPFAISGLPTEQAQKTIILALEAQGIGSASVNYRLRDWIFSRQWYWGEPFPLAHHPETYAIPVDPPVALPDLEDFRPDTSDDPSADIRPPLGRSPESWRIVDVDGTGCLRELNVMPQWAGSCWYYLRFMDPRNTERFCEPEKEEFFGPVDLYIGGAEHAVLHLLYARFWHKALYDLGHVSTPEPFRKLFNQGMITADSFADERGVYVDIRKVEFKEGVPFDSDTGKQLERFAGKMGKRYKNGLPPEEVGEEFGVDALRLYEMYMGPLEASAPWAMDGIRGMQRFLQRVWRNFVGSEGEMKLGGELSSDIDSLRHRTVLRVTEDLENLRFNTAIAAMIELNNELVALEALPQDLAKDFLKLLNPFAPHLAEELWLKAGFGNAGVSYEPWPVADAQRAKAETVEIPVQINGKVRAKFEADVDATKEAVEALALEQPNVQAHLGDKTPKKVIVVPNRLVNIVV